MRKYAYLKTPLKKSEGEYIYKIMFYKTENDGIYLFQYNNIDAVTCSYDYWYQTIDDMYEDWNCLIDERGWIDIGDPLVDCQHDAFLPIRIKGRNTETPEWGKMEILKDGKWVDYN